VTVTRHVLTILAVRDLDAATRFYREAFGWPQAVGTPVYSEFELPGGMRLGVYERNGFGRNTGQVPSSIDPGQLAPTELYFYADDVEQAIARIGAAGARELSALAPRAWGDEAAYFADPDGNVIVLARRITT
jgi:catechol 2,3-dioxygenase-like lactoylglutathione lyase family enzyme